MLSVQDYVQGLATTAATILLVLAVLIGGYRMVRYTHRHRS